MTDNTVPGAVDIHPLHSGSRWEPIAGVHAANVAGSEHAEWYAEPVAGRSPGGRRRNGLLAAAAVALLAVGALGGFAIGRAAGADGAPSGAVVQDGGTGFPGRPGLGDGRGFPGDGQGFGNGQGFGGTGGGSLPGGSGTGGTGTGGAGTDGGGTT